MAYAALKGRLDVVEYLVEGGADLDAKDEVRSANVGASELTRICTCDCGSMDALH